MFCMFVQSIPMQLYGRGIYLVLNCVFVVSHSLFCCGQSTLYKNMRIKLVISVKMAKKLKCLLLKGKFTPPPHHLLIFMLLYTCVNKSMETKTCPFSHHTSVSCSNSISVGAGRLDSRTGCALCSVSRCVKTWAWISATEEGDGRLDERKPCDKTQGKRERKRSEGVLSLLFYPGGADESLFAILSDV